MADLNATIQPFCSNNKTVVDFYPTFTENNVLKLSSWIFSVVNILVAPPLLLFIIWFERFGSDQRRTLINMLVSMICCTICIYLLVSHSIEVVRFSYGPLPDGLCCFQNLVKSVVFCSCLMFLDAIAIMRYIYIFWLKNLATFNDDFWRLFITLWIYGCSNIIMLAVHFLTECQTMGFFICNGQTTTRLQKLIPRVTAVIVFVSFALHLVIHLNILYFKYKGTSHISENHNNYKLLYLRDFQTSALTNFTSHTSTIVVLIGMLVCMHRLGNIKMNDINIFPNYICAYYINLLAPCLATDILIATFFSQKRVMRSFREELLLVLEH